MVWSMVYAYNRDDMNEDTVAELLNALEKVKLLFRWEQDGKVWGYWVGIDRPGRLPAPFRRYNKHGVLGAEPPKEQLKSWLASGYPQASLEIFAVDNKEVAEASLRLATGYSGIGLGIGIGSVDHTGFNSNEFYINHTGKKQRQRKKLAEKSLPIPEWIPAETWQAFVEMRAKIRRPLTKHATYLAVHTLEELKQAGNDPQLVLEQSILNSWQGLFELRSNHHDKHRADALDVIRASKRQPDFGSSDVPVDEPVGDRPDKGGRET